jgi:hypothetical protein
MLFAFYLVINTSTKERVLNVLHSDEDHIGANRKTEKQKNRRSGDAPGNPGFYPW